MSTNGDSGFDGLPILAELRERLNEHYRASAPAPQKHPRLVRSRRWRPLALIAVLVLGGTTGALAAAGVFESASVNNDIQSAVLRAINSPVCARRTVPATTTAVPPASLMSILAVLRRPAASGGTPADVLSGLGHEFPGLYVNYVRLARVADGLDWYVSVSADHQGILGPVHINRCIAAQTANFERELPHIPKAMRAAATQIFNAGLLRERSYDAHNPPPGINITGSAPENGIPGFGGGEVTAAEIGHYGVLIEGGSFTGSGPDTASVVGVVPDGVASVALHYDAGPASAYGHKHAPAANVTTKPVNNVIVVTVPRNVGNASPQTIIWRAPNGGTIKTITRP